MLRSVVFFYLLLASTILLLSRCAHPVSPQGGPKDENPPVVVACDPPNLATKFNGKSLRIDFNEFINLKNPLNEIFISPPLKKPPDARLRGKSLILRIEDTLAPKTTYSINFGNAITDLTEGNVLKGFNYVFSTGDFIDTLSLMGTLLSAFDHQPQKDVFIELYLNNNDTIPFDSLPLRVAPYYITKTDGQGNFNFQYLQQGEFKLFALADQNSDLIFNQPTEKIAFCDSLVKPYYISAAKPDTSRKDSLRIDSSMIDHISYSLFLFEESDTIQRLQKATYPIEGMVLLAFRFPVNEIRVVPMNFDSVAPWFIEEISKKRDSVRLWITRPEVDSLVARIFIDNKIFDTVHLEAPKKNDRGRTPAKEKQSKLVLSNSATIPGLNQFKNQLTVTFSFPLIRWDFTKVLLITETDTIHPEIGFNDSLRRKITINHKWDEAKTYKILIPDSVFFGIHNITHDSIIMNFRTKGEKDFGNLIVKMNMENRPGQYIVQLLNEKESFLYDEQIVTGSGKIRFDFMAPGKYKLKAINDRNENKRWDTGNYKLKIQPEEVVYFPKIVEIRANWDVEETWN
ncbi:MAG: Ig-like domain-containing protein [Bacteroidales bacterium]|nr:Ig-like domain-containing protein [Bacteroidales bacterium]